MLLDSLRVRDSLRAVRPPVAPRDSIKAPITRAESPGGADEPTRYRWTRDSIYATGALTLGDLLDRIPGATTLRAGWIASPTFAGYLGDLSRVRVFYDGLEMPALDPFAGQLRDFAWIPLWSVEEVRVERGATELRVHLRSWRVDRTTPSSRVDVATGDQNSNVFRGYFGRRYARGEILQVGGQQFSTTPPRFGTSSDQLSLLARVGVARPRWGVDGFVIRTSAHRGLHRRLTGLSTGIIEPEADSIPELDATRTDAYLRGSVGDPESGPWVQAVAASLGHRYTGRITEPRDTTESVGDASDSTRTQSQYVIAGGYARGPLRLSVVHRITMDSSTRHVPAVRASWESGRLLASAFADGRGADSTSRAEGAIRVTPLSFLTVSGAAGLLRDDRADASGGSFLRAEGELRVKRLWLGAGLLRRGESVLPPPTLLSAIDSLRDPAARRSAAEGTALFVTLRGTLYRGLQANLVAVQWENDSLAFYRPRYQTRSELFIATTLPRRFPTGNFGLRASLQHEYRSPVAIPNGAAGIRRTRGHRTISGLLEIRLLDAVLSYQYRNFLGEQFEEIPGYFMPRQVQFYGVRWNFWN